MTRNGFGITTVLSLLCVTGLVAALLCIRGFIRTYSPDGMHRYVELQQRNDTLDQESRASAAAEAGSDPFMDLSPKTKKLAAFIPTQVRYDSIPPCIIAVHVAIVLVTISLCLHLLRTWKPPIHVSFLALWTIAYLVMLLHVGWAAIATFHGSARAMLNHRLLVRHPVLDLALLVWWGIDLIVRWSPSRETSWARVSRLAVNVVVVLALFAAIHEDKASPAARSWGWVMAGVLGLCWLIWAAVRRPVSAADSAS